MSCASFRIVVRHGWKSGAENADQYFNPERAQRRFRLENNACARTRVFAASPQSSSRFPLVIVPRFLISQTMYWFLISMAVAVQASIHLRPPLKDEQLLTDTLLRELINQMGNDLVDTGDSYLEYQDKAKEIPIEIPDYDGIDTLNPNPSIRDQEYLQHSSLWSHQHLNNDDNAGGRQRIKPGSIKNIKDEKESTLPAYCTPPNPCPVGYTSENNCIIDFENTASFSRDYQNAQDCMCDKEHMLDCSESTNRNSLPSMHIPNSNFNQIVDQFQANDNPFFQGEKLPIAAKKGLNVY
ncbi:uncharacterized protein LOC108629913 [Ceratina calcarata]|uniref:Neuroendocrine protein 7B2 n=1 Tax=Ceratina calcarata TaxID=156304 RepID=A0AAJ7JAZ4_9HYME|nr:uncharacterized protein LOC108629913 [Ceratina calcarata]